MIQIVIYILLTSLLQIKGMTTPTSECSSAEVCEDSPDCSIAACNYIYSSKVYCNVYCYCKNSTLHQFSCSPGLLFNDIKLTCDYNINVNCSNRTVFEGTTTSFDKTSESFSKSSISTSEGHTTTEKNVFFNVTEEENNTVYENTNATFKPTFYDNKTTKTTANYSSILPESTELTTESEFISTVISDNASLSTNNIDSTNQQNFSSESTTEKANISLKDTETTKQQTTQSRITDSEILQETTSTDLTNEKLYNFKCLSRFGLFPDPENCNYFYQCSQYKANRLHCPHDLHFNPALQFCDWPSTAGCDNATLLESTLPSTTHILINNTNEPDTSTQSIWKTDNETVITINYKTTTPETFNTTVSEEKISKPQSTKATTDDSSFSSDGTEKIFTNMETTETYNNTETYPSSSTTYQIKNISTVDEDILTEKNNFTENKLETTKSPEISNNLTTHELISTTKEIQTANESSTVSGTFGDDDIMTTNELIFTTNSSNEDSTITEIQTSAVKSTRDDSISTLLPETNKTVKTFTCPSTFGLFPDPKSCEYFYQCSHFKAYRLQCPSKLHFNSVLQVCDWPYAAGCDNVTSPISTMSPTTLESIDNHSNSTVQEFTTAGNLSKHYFSTSNEYKVSTPIVVETGRDTSFSIIDYDQTTAKERQITGVNKTSDSFDERITTEGLTFNTTSSIGNSTFGEIPTTELKSTTDDSSSTENIHDTDESFETFTCQSRYGLFPDPENCNYFYQCSHFKAYQLQCPVSLHFNPVLQVCDWPEAAGCEMV